MNEFVLAVAGGRKTQSIIDETAALGPPVQRRLVITYTRAGQAELRRRLLKRHGPGGAPEVTGWYAFLLRHWVRPYVPSMFPGLRLRGLNFEGEPHRFAVGAERYVDANGDAYKRYLGKLAHEVHTASGGAVVDRLAGMYDVIYIDEAQDLGGWDLELLDLLFGSPIDLHLVGDLRQSLLSTNPQDQKNRKYRGLGMKAWIDDRLANGTIDLIERSETWRSSQDIATFADSIFGEGFTFAATRSLQVDQSDHSGLLTVRPEDVDDYVAQTGAICLRQKVNIAKIHDHHAPLNIGKVKGLTFDHVLLLPSKPMAQFITANKPLEAEGTMCAMYVAATRARHSLAIAVGDEADPVHGFARWTAA